MFEIRTLYVVKFAGVGSRVYVGIPLLISRKGAVVRRTGHLLFNGTTLPIIPSLIGTLFFGMF